MKRSNIYLTFATLLLAAACTQEPVPADGDAITVEASVGAPTKVSADGASFTAGDRIAVYAWLGSATENPSSRVVDGVVNTFDGSKWTPASLMRWKLTDDPHYFLGVYPAPAAAIADLTAVPYTLAPTDYTASDLLLATTPAGVKNTGAAVPLEFHHAMARLDVNLNFRSEWATPPAAGEVSVTVGAKSGATVNYLTQTVTPNGTVASIALAHATAATGFALGFRGIQVPQTGVTTVTVTIDGKAYTYTAATDIPLQSGQYTTLNLIVGRNKIELAGVSVSDWGEAPALPVVEPDISGDMLSTPLTLEAAVAGAVVNFDIHTVVATNPVYYRTWNGTFWSDWTAYADSSDVTLVNIGDKVQFKSDNAAYANTGAGAYYSSITLSAACYVYGNIMSLVGGDDFNTCFTLTADHAFYGLFAANVYQQENPVLFHNSKQLLLPATTLTVGCYCCMFHLCTSLTSLPEGFLPATTLAENCYGFMFNHCSGLTCLPEGLLPAGKDGVGSLARYCYQDMFQGCNGLTTLPAALLPATTLEDYCYNSMFSSCSNIQNTPVLPAPTLEYGCYIAMFSGCEKLNSVTCLATNITKYDGAHPGVGVLDCWLEASGSVVAGTKTVYTMPPSKMVGGDWEMYPSASADFGIPEGWTRQYVDVSGTQDFTFGTPGEWQ